MISPILTHLIQFDGSEFHNIEDVKREHRITDSQIMELEDDGYIEVPFTPVFLNEGERPAEEEKGIRLTSEGKFFTLSRMIIAAIQDYEVLHLRVINGVNIAKVDLNPYLYGSDIEGYFVWGVLSHSSKSYQVYLQNIASASEPLAHYEVKQLEYEQKANETVIEKSRVLKIK